MADDHTLYNGGTASVVFTTDGRALDVGDRITADPADPVLARLLEAGQLTDLGAVPAAPAKAASRPAASAPTDSSGD